MPINGEQQAVAVPTYRLWLSGTERDGKGSPIPVEDPSTGQVVAYCQTASIQDVNDAIEGAHKVFVSGIWSKAPRQQRADVLDKIAEVLQVNLRELIDMEVKQTGRAIREMNAQVPSLVRWYKYYASILRTEERPVLPTTGKLHNWVDRVPLGVVAQITPFNHPLLIATKKIAPALAAGNCIILKPSELTPITSLMLGKLFKQAGLPDGVFNVINGFGVDVGKALTEHPLIQKIDITGSTGAGRAIGAIAGTKLNNFTAELGGKAPLIVFEQADIDLAVNGIAFGSFIASGQTCIASTRILVQDTTYESVVKKLKSKCESIARRMDSPSYPSCSMGPLISQRQLDKVIELVKDARDTGVQVLVGGERMNGSAPGSGFDLSKGYYYPPTVLVNPPDATSQIRRARIWREEAFGPVIVVAPFSTETEAIEMANDSEFGLGAGIWTKDLSQAFRVAEQISAGITWVNTHHRNDPSSPWGGFGSSGVGSENGIEAYHAYTKMKTTIINYASSEEGLRTDDWFAEAAGAVRYG